MTIKVETDETRAAEKKAKAKKKQKKVSNPSSAIEIKIIEKPSILYTKDIIKVDVECCEEGFAIIYFDCNHDYLHSKICYTELKSVVMSYTELKTLYDDGEVMIRGDEKPNNIKMNRDYKFLIEEIMKRIVFRKEDI